MSRVGIGCSRNARSFPFTQTLTKTSPSCAREEHSRFRPPTTFSSGNPRFASDGRRVRLFWSWRQGIVSSFLGPAPRPSGRFMPSFLPNWPSAGGGASRAGVLGLRLGQGFAIIDGFSSREECPLAFLASAGDPAVYCRAGARRRPGRGRLESSVPKSSASAGGRGRSS